MKVPDAIPSVPGKKTTPRDSGSFVLFLFWKLRFFLNILFFFFFTWALHWVFGPFFLILLLFCLFGGLYAVVLVLCLGLLVFKRGS